MQTSFLSVSKQAVFILVISIAPFVGSAQKLPAHWQADMTLTISTGGGMRDYRSETTVSAAGITIITHNEDSTSTTHYGLKQEQLDQLLSVLRKYHFETLQSKPRKGLVYDMPTTTTLLSWGSNTLGYSVGATKELPETQKANASKLSTYIYQLEQSAADKK